MGYGASMTLRQDAERVDTRVRLRADQRDRLDQECERRILGRDALLEVLLDLAFEHLPPVAPRIRQAETITPPTGADGEGTGQTRPRLLKPGEEFAMDDASGNAGTVTLPEPEVHPETDPTGKPETAEAPPLDPVVPQADPPKATPAKKAPAKKRAPKKAAPKKKTAAKKTAPRGPKKK